MKLYIMENISIYTVCDTELSGSFYFFLVIVGVDVEEVLIDALRRLLGVVVGEDVEIEFGYFASL